MAKATVRGESHATDHASRKERPDRNDWESEQPVTKKNEGGRTKNEGRNVPGA